MKNKVRLKSVPGYCSTFVQSLQIYCVAKFVVVERALYGGRRGRLSCLWKNFEIDNFTLVWDFINKTL